MLEHVSRHVRQEKNVFLDRSRVSCSTIVRLLVGENFHCFLSCLLIPRLFGLRMVALGMHIRLPPSRSFHSQRMQPPLRNLFSRREGPAGVSRVFLVRIQLTTGRLLRGGREKCRQIFYTSSPTSLPNSISTKNYTTAIYHRPKYEIIKSPQSTKENFN